MEKAISNGRNPFFDGQFEDEPDKWYALRREVLDALQTWENSEDGDLRTDAERYRWLRSHGYKDRIGGNDCVMFGRGIDQTMPELLDAYLDKAREA